MAHAPPISTDARQVILAQLTALRVDLADPDSLTHFIEQRAALLHALDGIDAPWTAQHKALLQEALAAGEIALGHAREKRQDLARELTAFKAARQAAKQQATRAPPRWRKTI